MPLARMPNPVEIAERLGFDVAEPQLRLALRSNIAAMNRSSHSPYQTPEEATDYYKRKNLKHDLEAVSDLSSIIAQVLDSVETVSDGAEGLKYDIKKAVDSLVDDWQKSARGPEYSPMGVFQPSEVKDNELAVFLEDLTDELVALDRSGATKYPSIWEKVATKVKTRTCAGCGEKGFVSEKCPKCQCEDTWETTQ